MINIQDKKDCCGCNACGDICPKQCISFKTDNEGFWYPEVDKEKCIDCHLCEKSCPIINIGSLKKNDLAESECYAAEHKNLEVVFDSTSGGLFSALADIMYKDSGFVGGAVFNKDFSVKHFISNDKQDLARLRSSKYVQSSLIGFYTQVADLLKRGENVLVCGTPCQMAALRAYLRKDYDNLIIADFICRGINSPKVWHKYLDSFKERYGSPVVYCKAKSKEFGWRNLTQKVILADGRHVYETKDQSAYTRGYISTSAYCRPSCYSCQFKGYPRMSDITLADFWGVEKLSTGMDKNLGTSLVMVNSQKGRKFFERVKTRINFIQVPFKSIESGNPSLNLPIEQPLVDKTEFFADLDRMTFTEIANKYIFRTSVTHRSFKEKIKSLLRKLLKFAKEIHVVLLTTQYNPHALIQFIKYNTLAEIWRGDVLIPAPNCVISIAKSATIHKTGRTILGHRMRFSKSHLETRLLVDSNATLNLGPGTILSYGADIEVFKNATLTFKGHGGSNIGLTVICGEHIEFGDHVMMGRHVTVRDNNGSHYINRAGYKNSSPVIIGDKVWLCESCTIMHGVKIGAGAIVGAHSLVIQKVPDHSLVSGNPAKVVDTDVLWKY
jgi:acetyltransferase-like isoleucine patch superfamily enzyme/coenzyme F420-reducing hydrogenase beta subunit